MAFLNKENRKIEKRRRNLNSSGLYDTVNVFLGIAILIVAIFIFIDKEKYDKMFAVEFFMVSAMNICMGIKYFKRQEITKTIALFAAGIFFAIIMVISFIALWI